MKVIIEDSDPEITFAVVAVDQELAAGALVNGSDLRVGDPRINPLANSAGIPAQPTFPVDYGQPLTGTWKALQYMPSATTWSNGTNPPSYAVGGYFTRVA